MTVFEDLIEELKDENLLEDTVLDRKVSADVRAAIAEESVSARSEQGLFETDQFEGITLNDSLGDADLPQIETPSDEREFFRKRAMDEVSSLQMVEHVLSGVEREHMKMSPVSYDDLEAKKALHKFLQVSGDLRSSEHAEAELTLRQETETWSFALFERDQKISVANIRRFCEESRPVLSSQALISLARFYRNSAFSEDVRGKFDFVMTRLFSRDSGDETRRLLFPRTEMIGHINTLYANWSSIALYSKAEDEVEVSLTVTRFDEFGVDIESSESFDELLETDFFNKVRVYKQEAAEMFYVPEVISAAIECNIRIGNRYIDLIEREKENLDPVAIEEKYGYAYDQLVSNAAGKTLLLVDLLKLRLENEDLPEREAVQAFTAAKPKEEETQVTRERFDFFGANKWLMAATIICVLVSVGTYFWAEKTSSEDSETVSAKSIKIDDAEVAKNLRSLRSTDETLYAVAQPGFEALSDSDKKQFLQKMYKLANDRGLRKVNLLNAKGRSIAFASKERVDLISQ